MDAFIEALENNNFDIDSYITDTVDTVDTGSNIDPFSTAQAKVEANSIWQAKLSDFMDCERQRKQSNLPKDTCSKFSSDFYNYTFSLYVIPFLFFVSLIYFCFTHFLRKNSSTIRTILFLKSWNQLSLWFLLYQLLDFILFYSLVCFFFLYFLDFAI